jgi:hypothetical protein
LLATNKPLLKAMWLIIRSMKKERGKDLHQIIDVKINQKALLKSNYSKLQMSVLGNSLKFKISKKNFKN